MTQYRVVAPLVNVKTMTTEGLRYIYIYEGGTVPSDASEEWIGFHLRDQMIEAVPEPEPPPPPPEPKPAARGRAAPKGE